MNLRKLVNSAATASVVALAMLMSSATQASVVIAGTRVVYDAGDTEVTLRLSNVGKTPSLVQVWLDTGDPNADPGQLDLPFIMAPPLARIDPGKSQTIRITYTGEALPTDRESLMWFNVLEVPPKPSASEAGANYVQLAFRSRLKFFFRPGGLQESVDDAPARLTWRRGTQDGKPALLVSNPTPYHVTIIEAQVGEGPHAPKFDDGDMVAPGGELALPLSGEFAAGGKVLFTTLNDYGGPVKHEAAMQ
ncbi:fimbria/pilus periplasmic chaperone [Paraburkholderia silvatlantica]|uniref:fimbria/pilus periplasmic chaperone n=1 Tax=Paraburkholderia silvatlantica TaxID=321895 RepID=UPI003751CDDE